MERHKCKLCTRSFSNGRALGGHMKAHLATLPLPPPPKTTLTHHQLGDRTESASSSSYCSSSGEDDDDEEEIKSADVEEKALVYGLRENPKKSFRFADPEFAFSIDAGSVVQDRESETESKNPTKRRSKRTGKSGNFDFKKLKLKNHPSLLESPSSPAEPEPVSSVSDTSPEEDVAMCLMMLSRDVWMKKNHQKPEPEYKEQEEKEIIKTNKIRGKLRCEKCRKLFRSSQALSTHKRICSLNATELKNSSNDGNERIFECPYCFKVFGSGQALGGHKRSHLMGSSSSSPPTLPNNAAENSAAELKQNNHLIDLNLPAPMEEDDFSVVSDA